jgi:hypothetical protein
MSRRPRPRVAGLALAHSVRAAARGGALTRSGSGADAAFGPARAGAPPFERPLGAPGARPPALLGRLELADATLEAGLDGLQFALGGRGLPGRALGGRGLAGRGLAARGLDGRGLARRGLAGRGLARRALAGRGLLLRAGHRLIHRCLADDDAEDAERDRRQERQECQERGNAWTFCVAEHALSPVRAAAEAVDQRAAIV